jgi:16S rRNA (guanine527-N7)-methyltransferase
MREPAATPITCREDRNVARRSISLSSTDARAAREALDVLDASQLPLPAGFGDRVERYVALLLEANALLNLTRIVDPPEIARLHLLDALTALPLLDAWRPARAIDLGTGGGVPGLVLALARPDVAWTLVDSVAKKAAAVARFAESLELSSVQVRAERAEVLGRDPAERGTYDVAVARALAPLPVLVEYALPLLRVGGHLLAWKAAMPDDERAAGRDAAALLGGGPPSVHDPAWATLGERRLVEVEKLSATPDLYPRRPGVPGRRPLGPAR